MSIKSEDLLIAGLGATILALAFASFFFKPAYPQAADRIIDGLLGALTVAMGYKFGKTMPQQVGDTKPGQQSTETTVKQVTETPAEPKP